MSEAVSIAEALAKVGSVALGCLYTIGLLVSVIYQSTLHIRSISFLEPQYILVGAYFCVFVFLNLIIPIGFLKRTLSRSAYILIFVLILMLFDSQSHPYFDYFNFRLNHTSGFVFSPAEGGIIVSSLIGLVVMQVGSLGIAFLLAEGGRRSEINRSLAIVFIVVALTLMEYALFSGYVYPNIPETMAGGSFPEVVIVLSPTAPAYITSFFELEPEVKGVYHARLVHLDSDAVLLKSTSWPALNTIEVPRDLVLALEYWGTSLEMGKLRETTR